MVPFAGIGPATSPLPRECSTTEPKGQSLHLTHDQLERETGIEPVSLAWKAKVLPLNYSRIGSKPQGIQFKILEDAASCTEIPFQTLAVDGRFSFFAGGGDWIRTSVGVSQQIYSLPPLATRAPLLSESRIMPLFWPPAQAAFSFFHQTIGVCAFFCRKALAALKCPQPLKGVAPRKADKGDG